MVEESAHDGLRVVDPVAFSEPVHHALDEVLTNRLNAGEAPPTLRVWRRETPAVPFGRFQSFSDEVEVEYAREHGVVPVRRLTGGGSMYVAPGDVVTYSLYLPEEWVPEDIEESYADLDAPAIEALQELGLDVRHEPLNDVEHDDGKIGGSAQLRSGGTVLHHTTMSYDLDTREMLRVLRIGEEKVSDKAVQSAETRVAVMTDYLTESRDAVIDAIVEAYAERFGGERGELTADEREAALELADAKFSTPDWNEKL
ncbi:lipoate--protein ligase family protein [Halarchaeum sp. P4]|uniref:lipoate--protein ligase family protein n=1 Tax=Halarchaeum sp. P4 TaxID=3421639 RepID=UPI003EBB3EC8